MKNIIPGATGRAVCPFGGGPVVRSGSGRLPGASWVLKDAFSALAALKDAFSALNAPMASFSTPGHPP
ncbi:hypothetical protein [Amycolatopsis samaneae]|uniref:Uncharacterized protein n=1 Tax=Amycolatopsis samaneae TaxID=664691 RepID=A0ABW5GM39_9PSEU